MLSLSLVWMIFLLFPSFSAKGESTEDLASGVALEVGPRHVPQLDSRGWEAEIRAWPYWDFSAVSSGIQ
jgi:hypothetical protein